jgi:hypothetical protein
MAMKVLNIIVIALAVIAASVFASRIPPMWEEFSIAVFVLALAIFYQRKSLKKEIMEARSEGEGYTLEAFEKFSSELEKALNLVLEKDFHDEEKTASVLEEWIERISIEMDYYRVNITEQIGIGKFTEIMASFAKAERRLNRGYSALIDGYVEDAKENIRDAVRLLAEAQKTIKKFV